MDYETLERRYGWGLDVKVFVFFSFYIQNFEPHQKIILGRLFPHVHFSTVHSGDHLNSLADLQYQLELWNIELILRLFYHLPQSSS